MTRAVTLLGLGWQGRSKVGVRSSLVVGIFELGHEQRVKFPQVAVERQARGCEVQSRQRCGRETCWLRVWARPSGGPGSEVQCLLMASLLGMSFASLCLRFLIEKWRVITGHSFGDVVRNKR